MPPSDCTLKIVGEKAIFILPFLEKIKTKIRSESAKESILSEINKIYNKIELNIDEQNMKRVVMEARQKEILDKIDEEIKNV